MANTNNSSAVMDLRKIARRKPYTAADTNLAGHLVRVSIDNAYQTILMVRNAVQLINPKLGRRPQPQQAKQLFLAAHICAYRAYNSARAAMRHAGYDDLRLIEYSALCDLHTKFQEDWISPELFSIIANIGKSLGRPDIKEEYSDIDVPSDFKLPNQFRSAFKSLFSTCSEGKDNWLVEEVGSHLSAFGQTAYFNYEKSDNLMCFLFDEATGSISGIPVLRTEQMKETKNESVIALSTPCIQLIPLDSDMDVPYVVTDGNILFAPTQPTGCQKNTATDQPKLQGSPRPAGSKRRSKNKTRNNSEQIQNNQSTPAKIGRAKQEDKSNTSIADSKSLTAGGSAQLLRKDDLSVDSVASPATTPSNNNAKVQRKSSKKNRKTNAKTDQMIQKSDTTDSTICSTDGGNVIGTPNGNDAHASENALTPSEVKRMDAGQRLSSPLPTSPCDKSGQVFVPIKSTDTKTDESSLEGLLNTELNIHEVSRDMSKATIDTALGDLYKDLKLIQHSFRTSLPEINFEVTLSQPVGDSAAVPALSDAAPTIAPAKCGETTDCSSKTANRTMTSPNIVPRKIDSPVGFRKKTKRGRVHRDSNSAQLRSELPANFARARNAQVSSAGSNEKRDCHQDKVYIPIRNGIMTSKSSNEKRDTRKGWREVRTKHKRHDTQYITVDCSLECRVFDDSWDDAPSLADIEKYLPGFGRQSETPATNTITSTAPVVPEKKTNKGKKVKRLGMDLAKGDRGARKKKVFNFCDTSSMRTYIFERVLEHFKKGPAVVVHSECMVLDHMMIVPILESPADDIQRQIQRMLRGSPIKSGLTTEKDEKSTTDKSLGLKDYLRGFRKLIEYFRDFEWRELMQDQVEAREIGGAFREMIKDVKRIRTLSSKQATASPEDGVQGADGTLLLLRSPPTTSDQYFPTKRTDDSVIMTSNFHRRRHFARKMKRTNHKVLLNIQKIKRHPPTDVVVSIMTGIHKDRVARAMWPHVMATFPQVAELSKMPRWNSKAGKFRHHFV